MGLFKKTNSDSASQPTNVKTKKDATEKTANMKDLYKEEKAVKAVGDKKSQNANGQAYRVLVKPLITEKAGFLGAENKYVFSVPKSINKVEVAKAVQEVYGIKPVSVNIMSKPGKNVRYGRTMGKKKDWKKAIVALPEGKTINIYEGV